MKLALAFIAVALLSAPALAQSSNGTILWDMTSSDMTSPDMAPPDILPNGIDVFGGYRPHPLPGSVFIAPQKLLSADEALRIPIPGPDLGSESPLICAGVGHIDPFGGYTRRQSERALCQGGGWRTAPLMPDLGAAIPFRPDSEQ